MASGARTKEQSEGRGEKRGRWGFWLRVLAPVMASLGGLLTLRLLGPDYLTEERLSGWIEPLGPWAPLAFIAFLAVRPVTLLPGQVFTAVGGILFGVWHATLYALIGSLLAAMLTFVLARWLGKPLMRRIAGGRYLHLKRVARRHDFMFASLSTVNPLMPTDVMIAVAAASGGRFLPTVLGTLIGTAPGTWLTAYFGSSLGRGQYVEAVFTGVALLVSLVIGVFVGRRVVRELREQPEDPGSSEGPPPLRVGGVNHPEAAR